MSGNSVWPQALGFSKTRQVGPFLEFFNELLSTQVPMIALQEYVQSHLRFKTKSDISLVNFVEFLLLKSRTKSSELSKIRIFCV